MKDRWRFGEGSPVIACMKVFPWEAESDPLRTSEQWGITQEGPPSDPLCSSYKGTAQQGNSVGRDF